MNEFFEDDDEQVQIDRKTYLMLFYKIMRLEHENKHTKQFSDKEIQEKIKKAIQTSVKN